MANRGDAANPLHVTGNLSATIDTTGLATSTKQSDGSQKTQIVDGSGNVIGATSNALDVNIVSSDVATGGTSSADDADFTAGTTAGTPAMGVYESTPTSVTDGDLGTVGITQGRRLKTSATVDAALPAGTNNIGDVDILSIAAGDNNIGNVDVVSSALPTGASTLAEQQTQTTHLATIAGDTTDIETAVELIDDAVVADDAAFTPGTTKVMMSGFEVDETGTDSVDEGDAGAARMSTNRNIYTQIRDGQGNERSAFVTSNGDLQMAFIRTSVTPGTSASHLGKAEDAAHSTGDTGIAIWGVRNDANTARSDTDGDYTPISTDLEGSIRILGNREHDDADSGRPIKIGYKAETSPKGITLVSDGDRTDAYADADGLQMVKLNTSNADIVSERVSNTDGASTAFTNFSAVASTRNYVTNITAFRTDAGTSLVYVDFRDGTAGSVLYSVPVPPTGGVTINSATPLFKTTANTALAYDVSAATNSVIISVSGFQSKA